MSPNFVMYVGDLHPDATKPTLVKKFIPAGHIHSILLCRDGTTSSSLDYTYINFHHQIDVNTNHTEQRRMQFHTLFLHLIPVYSIIEDICGSYVVK